MKKCKISILKCQFSKFKYYNEFCLIFTLFYLLWFGSMVSQRINIMLMNVNWLNAFKIVGAHAIIICVVPEFVCCNEKNSECGPFRSTGKSIVLHRDDNNTNNWLKRGIKKRTIATWDSKKNVVAFESIQVGSLIGTTNHLQNAMECQSKKSQRKMCEL